MTELKRGSKLIGVEPTFKECSVKVLKDENEKLKNKIVSLKEDFQRIINEVQTLQYYVVKHENKTKEKFRKIKIIVSTLKKEREFLFAQNQKYCNQLKVLVKENDSLRKSLGQGEMEKETRHECSTKEEKTKEESKQFAEEKKEETPKEEVLGVETSHPLMNATSETNSLLLGHDITEEQSLSHEEIKNVTTEKGNIIQNKKNSYKPNKESTFYRNVCKKTLQKKTRSMKHVFVIKEKKRALYIILNYLQTGKNIQSILSRNKGNDKNISRRNIIRRKDPFFQRRHCNQEKRIIQWNKISCDFTTIQNIRRIPATVKVARLQYIYVADTNEMEARTEGETNDIGIVLPPTSTKERVMRMEQKEPTERSIGTTSMEIVFSNVAVAEKETEIKKDILLSDLHVNSEEWNEEQKETEYLTDAILRICEKLRAQDFEKVRMEIKKYVPNANILCKKENEFYFTEHRKFLDEKHISGTLSTCIDLLTRQITGQDEKINAFEMKINNINIFSHNLVAMLKEDSYKKIKKEKQYNDILVMVRNIINECHLKKESFN